MLLLLLAVAVAAKPAPNCSDAKCGVACAWTAGAERCHPQRLCLDAGAACAVKAKRLERLTGYAANQSAEEKACAPPPPPARVPAIARRSDADARRCRVARCARANFTRKAATDDLFQRYATYRAELAVVTPHKAGGKYAKEMFARAYGCAPTRAPGDREVVMCGDDGKVRKNMTVVLLVREPLDRALAQYNHLIGDARSKLEAVCAKGSYPLTADERLAYAKGSTPGDDARRLAFLRWLRCLEPNVPDAAREPDGIEYRHFQPASRYAYAAEADFVGRVERLGDVMAALAAVAPRLNASLDDASRRPDPWLFDGEKQDAEKQRGGSRKEQHKALDYVRAHELQAWGVQRCDLGDDAAAAEAKVSAFYATDFDCFGDLLPRYEAADARRRLRRAGTQLACEGVDEATARPVRAPTAAPTAAPAPSPAPARRARGRRGADRDGARHAALLVAAFLAGAGCNAAAARRRG
ncbi:hypothetical protein JL721_2786 [Aureococcus anophagefferens]|nr:hypothetical protein JL721_2786 [Aureococcus anophagefferens]